ncbi:hypothetical protein ZOSMA_116G00850 [Zostera marina]|uniref:SHSP domain-containing protein n=1 Tax=Zostera marina TaxID=29655 RepID=A0A0K9Q270_ZOSMR|nr:hypothetical protein ZOSMA_116G00850 [Zostera marina]
MFRGCLTLLLLISSGDLGASTTVKIPTFQTCVDSGVRKMKVHPVSIPRKRNNIAFREIGNRSLAEGIEGRQKKLRRLPHTFSKVLELPFRSDADVDVQEDVMGFVFVVAADNFGDDVRAHAIHIHPNIIKVVIRDSVDGDGDLELDRWRFRLPSCTRPELAVANYVDGELVVRIPKDGISEEAGGNSEGGIGRIVSVR